MPSKSSVGPDSKSAHTGRPSVLSVSFGTTAQFRFVLSEPTSAFVPGTSSRNTRPRRSPTASAAIQLVPANGSGSQSSSNTPVPKRQALGGLEEQQLAVWAWWLKCHVGGSGSSSAGSSQATSS